MKKDRICGYCRYWQPTGNRDAAEVGECRRNSPVNLIEVPNRGYRPWINTGRGDWCGDWLIFHGDE